MKRVAPAFILFLPRSHGYHLCMPYPLEIESWWLEAACSATGQSDHVAALQKLEGAAARLSNHFTMDRPAAFRDLPAWGGSRCAP